MGAHAKHRGGRPHAPRDLCGHHRKQCATDHRRALIARACRAGFRFSLRASVKTNSRIRMMQCWKPMFAVGMPLGGDDGVNTPYHPDGFPIHSHLVKVMISVEWKESTQGIWTRLPERTSSSSLRPARRRPTRPANYLQPGTNRQPSKRCLLAMLPQAVRG